MPLLQSCIYYFPSIDPTTVPWSWPLSAKPSSTRQHDVSVLSDTIRRLNDTSSRIDGSDQCDNLRVDRSILTALNLFIRGSRIQLLLTTCNLMNAVWSIGGAIQCGAQCEVSTKGERIPFPPLF